MTPAANDQPLIARLTRPFQVFFEREASSSVLLLLMTVTALVWANSPLRESYEHLIHSHMSLVVGSFHLELTFHEFVNDVLMAIFFFVVGMEIKRELVHGELSTRSRALLPVSAALGGMVFPAGIYALLHMGGPALRGWGIPMATDIAFAVAALAVFGSRVPSGLKIFLLALAIADDIGAVAVIAVFYTADLSLAWLGIAALALLFTAVLNGIGVRNYLIYLAVGAFAWYAMFESGVHATIAGVALGFLTPARPLESVEGETLVERGGHLLQSLRDLAHKEADHGGHRRHELTRKLQQVGRATLSPLDLLTNLLHPLVAFVIMPVFALANAGVSFDASTLSNPEAIRVGAAVALGLLIGKPVGITLFAWASVALGLASLPRGVTWIAVIATGILAGIGFTVALFVTALAFDDPAFTAGAKIGILGASFLATVLGVAILSRVLPEEAIDAD